jgi:hypothetical protein
MTVITRGLRDTAAKAGAPRMVRSNYRTTTLTTSVCVIPEDTAVIVAV